MNRTRKFAQSALVAVAMAGLAGGLLAGCGGGHDDHDHDHDHHDGDGHDHSKDAKDEKK